MKENRSREDAAKCSTSCMPKPKSEENVKGQKGQSRKEKGERRKEKKEEKIRKVSGREEEGLESSKPDVQHVRRR